MMWFFIGFCVSVAWVMGEIYEHGRLTVEDLGWAAILVVAGTLGGLITLVSFIWVMYTKDSVDKVIWERKNDD